MKENTKSLILYIVLLIVIIIDTIIIVSAIKSEKQYKQQIESIEIHQKEISLEEQLMLDSIRIADSIHYVHELELTKIACAIAKHESKNNPNAYNPNHDCVGWLQITPICVKAANQILGYECFYLEDRWDIQGSYAIFKIIMNKKNPELDLKKACKIWNPTAGNWYYEDIKRIYDSFDTCSHFLL